MNELDEKIVIDFKSVCKDINNNNLLLSCYAYTLINQNEKKFKELCEEMEISKAKMSKLVTVGRILEEVDLPLPKSYSAIYELKTVAENINDFNDYLIKNNVVMSEMSRRDVIEWSYKYMTGDEEDDYEETVEVAESFIEKVVEEKIKDSFDKDQIYDDIAIIGCFLGELEVDEEQQSELNECLMAVNRIKKIADKRKE